jgi:hypothetical protein
MGNVKVTDPLSRGITTTEGSDSHDPRGKPGPNRHLFAWSCYTHEKALVKRQYIPNLVIVDTLLGGVVDGSSYQIGNSLP